MTPATAHIQWCKDNPPAEGEGLQAYADRYYGQATTGDQLATHAKAAEYAEHGAPVQAEAPTDTGEA